MADLGLCHGPRAFRKPTGLAIGARCLHPPHGTLLRCRIGLGLGLKQDILGFLHKASVSPRLPASTAFWAVAVSGVRS